MLRITGSSCTSHSSRNRTVAVAARERAIWASFHSEAGSALRCPAGAWVAGASRGRAQRQPPALRWRRTLLGDSGRRKRASRNAASSPTVQQLWTSPTARGLWLAWVSTMCRARRSRGGLPGRGRSSSPLGPSRA